MAFQIRQQGKGSIMHGLNSSIVKSLFLPLPDIEEQSAILSFLEHETAKIDTLIEKQQQLIKLLKEKRQAVISHAVTKGLNPQAPMKDSGVEWFDAVPLHWKIMELKFSAADGYKTFTDGDWIESPYITDSGVRLLQTGNVGIGEFKEKGFRYISESSFKN
ncbi:restriction endonuclease subunit S [Vibrio taketomensis]|uniref:restriction endonuclease subunit S n=1 Tax=Vibrio taketomensis TaxID=2572923 RepID=UPI001E58F462|nr:restriction endonuclease subunit S [Vibrio taketomensis]